MAKTRKLIQIENQNHSENGASHCLATSSSKSKKTRKRVSVTRTNKDKDIFVSKDGLPEYQSYLDVKYDKGVGNSHIEHTRIFLEEPTQALKEDTLQKKREIEDAGQAFKTTGTGHLFDRFGQLCKRTTRTKTPLYNYCLNAGFSEKFARDICRLFIRSYKDRPLKRDHYRGVLGQIEKAVSQLEICINNDNSLNINIFGILDITVEHWLSISSVYPDQDKFASARDIFSSYPPTSLNGSLVKMRISENGHQDTKSLDEHTSDFFVDKGYTDEEMYQINAILFSYIYKHEEAIAKYNAINETALAGSNKTILSDITLKLYKELFGKNISNKWLSPDIVSSVMKKAKGRTTHNSKYIKLKNALITDLIELHQNDDLFDVAIDTNLLWFKHGGKTINDILRKHSEFKDSGAIYAYEERILHGFIRRCDRRNSWLSFYLGKDAVNKRFNHLHVWCLANLLRIVAGVNKEVALSIPSRTRGGKSILEREQSLYRSNKQVAKEIELYGVKFRSNGDNLFKHIVLGKKSAIYRHLKFYENNIKLDSSGKFFETSTSLVSSWATCGISYQKTKNKDIPEYFRFYDIDGNAHTRYECERFRKVYATQKFLQLIRDTDNPVDLVEKFKNALHHNNVDMTLSSYLMKDPHGRNALDAAIVAITSDKLEEALSFKGEIDLKGKNNNRKKVFLCECSDPFNPTHNYYIADECMHYDLCLGCKRSVITKKHLPYICARILQYEIAKEANPQNWSLMFEDKWMIAHDALKKYQEKAKGNGSQIIEKAWSMAKNNEVLLPPIIEGGI